MPICMRTAPARLHSPQPALPQGLQSRGQVGAKVAGILLPAFLSAAWGGEGGVTKQVGLSGCSDQCVMSPAAGQKLSY